MAQEFVFDGVTLTLGIGLGAAANQTVRRADIDGRKAKLKDVGGIGISLDPFRFVLECDHDGPCELQAGDTIEVRASSIFLVDVTTIKWNLCGGKCRGEKTELGFSLGLEIKGLKWVID